MQPPLPRVRSLVKRAPDDAGCPCRRGTGRWRIMSSYELPTPELAIASMVDYPPGATYGPRTLTDFELVWLLRGSARWRCHSPDSHQLDLEPGSLLLARPGMRDSY